MHWKKNKQTQTNKKEDSFAGNATKQISDQKPGVYFFHLPKVTYFQLGRVFI